MRASASSGDIAGPSQAKTDEPDPDMLSFVGVTENKRITDDPHHTINSKANYRTEKAPESSSNSTCTSGSQDSDSSYLVSFDSRFSTGVSDFSDRSDVQGDPVVGLSKILNF